MTQFKKVLKKNRLWLLSLIIFLFSVSVTAAQDKVVVIPLFGDESQATVPAPVEVTGQTACYDESGDVISCTGADQDGDIQAGEVWPNPRFKDNGNGTVTDNLTGLIWLQNANCFGKKDWTDALGSCNNLADGQCGLSDGSSTSDCCLPNVRELQSLIHYGFYDPPVPNTSGTGKWSDGYPFTGVQSYYYWSSTTVAFFTIPDRAWFVFMNDSAVSYNSKAVSNCVWPVRGGND